MTEVGNYGSEVIAEDGMTVDQVGSYGVLGVHVRVTGEVRVRVTDIYVRHWEWC